MYNQDKDLEKRLAALEEKLAKAKHLETQDKPTHKRLTLPLPQTNRRLWMATTVSLLILAISVTLYIWQHPSKPATTTSTLQQVARSAGFEVYFPGDLPHGFSFDPKNVSLSSGIVIYTIAGPNSSTMTVTEQKKPQNFDYHSIQTDTSFKTPYGVATAYEQSDKSMGSLISDTTWVVCNTSKAIGAKAMEAVLQSLQATQ